VAAFDSPKLNDGLFRTQLFFRHHTGIAALVVGILLMVWALWFSAAAMAFTDSWILKRHNSSLFTEARIFFKSLAIA
jgi:hypothetical protein